MMYSQIKSETVSPSMIHQRKHRLTNTHIMPMLNNGLKYAEGLFLLKLHKMKAVLPLVKKMLVSLSLKWINFNSSIDK